MAALFHGRHWTEIPSNEIPIEGSFLFYFEPEAFRFYLPAFMRAVLYDFDRLDTLPTDILSALTRDEEKTTLPRMRAFGLFSAAQKHATRRFLEFVRDEHDDDIFLPLCADTALEGYWAK